MLYYTRMVQHVTWPAPKKPFVIWLLVFSRIYLKAACPSVSLMASGLLGLGQLKAWTGYSMHDVGMSRPCCRLGECLRL